VIINTHKSMTVSILFVSLVLICLIIPAYSSFTISLVVYASSSDDNKKNHNDDDNNDRSDNSGGIIYPDYNNGQSSQQQQQQESPSQSLTQNNNQGQSDYSDYSGPCCDKLAPSPLYGKDIYNALLRHALTNLQNPQLQPDSTTRTLYLYQDFHNLCILAHDPYYSYTPEKMYSNVGSFCHSEREYAAQYKVITGGEPPAAEPKPIP
jgi:hypothetical protein